MKNIGRIFFRDLKAIATHFFPLVIILGVFALPSLYAWFNIYSNWDPYANTANIQIAVFSEDKGYTNEDGEFSNMGESIVEGLKENTAIGWVFCESKEQALSGLYAGDYYAAIVVDENFSHDMYSVFDQDFENPVITYYENEKKNAVATKITDTAVATLQQNVNKQFISVVVSTIFESTNEVSEDLRNSTFLEHVLNKLYEMQGEISEYDEVLDSLQEAQSKLDVNLLDASDKLDNTSNKISSSRSKNRQVQQSFIAEEASAKEFLTNIDEGMASISVQVENLYNNWDGLSVTEVQNSLSELVNDLTNINNSISAATAVLKSTTTNNSYVNQYKQTLEEYQKEVSAMLDTAQKLLDEINKYVDQVNGAIDAANQAKKDIQDKINSQVDLDAVRAQIEEAQKQLDEVKEALGALADVEPMKSAIAAYQKNIDELKKQLEDSGIPMEDGADTDFSNLNTEMSTLNKEEIERIQKEIAGYQAEIASMEGKIDEVEEAAANYQKQIQEYENKIAAAQQKILEYEEEAQDQVNQAGITISGVSQDLYDVFEEQMNNLSAIQQAVAAYTQDDLLNAIEGVFDQIDGVLGELNVGITDAGSIVDAAQETSSATALSLIALGNGLDLVNNRLGSVITKVEGIQDNGAIDIVLNLLEGNPDAYGEFFSEPVQVTTEAVYAVDNYGSAVNPFYTTLAIWVGCTILVSIVKVKVPDQYLGDATPAQLFFGRYLLFLLFSEIQTAIIVFGDVFLLRCQIMHPWMFYFAAMLASLAFSMLIYSLTLAFGDVGKALAVIIMVIQIAGSGGTYPIEILPDFYKNVYIFFPFPYAINAMREALAGLYAHDYWIFMFQLSLFAIGGLALGLVFRLPFIKITHFLEERMEDTELM